MKTLISGMLAIVLIVTLLEAAPPALYTRPSAPSTDSLRPLGLKRRWFAYVPVEDRRDRVLFAQAFQSQLVLQTAGGAVIALNGETGETEWRLLLGVPYRAKREPAAANATTVFVVADTTLYAIDRKSGRLEWDLRLPGILSTEPSVDDNLLFFSTNQGGLHAYVLPQGREKIFQLIRKEQGIPMTEEETRTTASIEPSEKPSQFPEALWSAQTGTTISLPLVVTSDRLFFVDTAGTIYVLSKLQRGLFEMHLSDTLAAAPMGQSGETIYVPRRDSHVQSFERQFNRIVLRWRTNVGGRPLIRPIAMGKDLYLATSETGLVCLESDTGSRRWTKPGIERFIAAGERILFAADGRGRVVLLDRRHGITLGYFDASAFSHRVRNEYTDRLFLVNHDGLVVCIHLADQDQPFLHQVAPKETSDPTQPADSPKDVEPNAGTS